MIRFPGTDIEFAMQDEIDTLRAEVERLKEACDGYLGHAAGLRDENAKLLERIRFADQEFAAECAGLRGEVERQSVIIKGFENSYNASLRRYETLRMENERLREALGWISDNDVEADSEYQPYGVKPRQFALKARAALRKGGDGE
jgi:regulator of replication initiation timing